MFQTLSTRGAIAASTALVAVAVVVTILPTYQSGPDLRLREVATQKTDATRMEEERVVDAEPMIELAPMELAEADMDASAPEALMAAPPTPTSAGSCTATSPPGTSSSSRTGG